MVVITGVIVRDAIHTRLLPSIGCVPTPGHVVCLSKETGLKDQRDQMTLRSKPQWNKSEGSMVLMVLLLMVCPQLGCSDVIEVKLEDYLEEIEFETPLNSTVEVSLGKYSIPIPVQSNDNINHETQIDWIRMKFQLYAVVANENQSKVEAALQRNRGLYRDGVLKICRAATLDDIADPRLTAIVLRLTDLSRSVLGQKNIRQLLCPDLITEAI